jgi:hypothetical protein
MTQKFRPNVSLAYHVKMIYKYIMDIHLRILVHLNLTSVANSSSSVLDRLLYHFHCILFSLFCSYINSVLGEICNFVITNFMH